MRWCGIFRANGVMRGVIASGENLDVDALVAKARAIRKMDGTDLASVVTTKVVYEWDSNEPKNQTGDAFLSKAEGGAEQMHVVAYDFGIKENILRMLTRENCRVTVVPATTPAKDVLAMDPDGVFFSNGPGDPEPLEICGRECAGVAVGRNRSSGYALGIRYSGWRWAGRLTS